MDTPIASPHRSRTSPRFHAALSLYVAAATALLLLAAHASLPRIGATFPGFFVLDNGILAAVYGPDWTGLQAGLPLNGGVLTRVDDIPFEGGRALLARTAALRPGETITYTVAHQGTTRAFPVATMRLDAAHFATTLGSYLFIAATLLAIGGLALAMRPDLAAARALGAALGSVGALFALAVDHLVGYSWVWGYHLLEAATPVAILQLALVFPRERASIRVRRCAVAGLAALLLAGAAAQSLVFRDRPDLAWRWDQATYLLMAVLGLVMIASFAESFARGRDPAERTRAALVFTGGLVGFLLPAAALLAFFVLGIEVSTVWWAPFLAVFALFLLYAIVRHDLLEAERVIRLGVGYVLVTSALLVAYALALAGLTRFVWPAVASGPLPSFLLVLGVALSFEPMRRRVQAGIDRVFYRSTVDPAVVLEQSSEALAHLASEAEIAACVETTLGDALGCEWVRVTLDGTEAAPGAPLREAIAFRGERLGSLACGPKRSGAPFSGAELHLARGLAAQAALATLNARSLQALRDAQVKLLRNERLAAVGEFAGAVAHGIRNPLAAIRAAAQVAHLRARRGEAAVDSLANLLAAADRLDQRITSLLDFSRPFELRLRRIDLGAVLADVRRALEPQSRAAGVGLEVASGSLEVEADPTYLEEALVELGGNAIRAMARGGSLRIAFAREGGDAVVRVSDTGGGVPAGVADRLFDLFFTTRAEGSGVGLSMVKKIAELHGGSVALERTGPEGTVFRLALPVPR